MDEEWSYAVRRIGRACVCGAAKMKEEGEGLDRGKLGGVKKGWEKLAASGWSL